MEHCRSRVEQVSKWLEQKYNILVSSAWVQACVKWIEEEENEKDAEEMYQLVNEQLLHSDLAEVIRQGSFYHKDLQEKGTLEGVFFIQINSAVDISCSAYSLLQRLKKGEALTRDSNRMLLLDVTDGHTTAQVMEYQHIDQIDCNVKPGTKLLIKGKIQYKLGVLMATKENVVCLGGIVESLLERNGTEIQLHKLLYGTAHTKTNSLWSSEFRRESMTESNNEVDEPPGTITSCTSIKEIENKLERAVLIEWLDDLKHHDWGEYPEVIVKGEFYDIGEKISHISGQWIATVIIRDLRRTTVEVSISNAILEELIGFSATTFIRRICPQKGDASTRCMASKGFAFCQSVISKIDCSILLEKRKIADIPCIIKLLKI